jgi:hypothetical protein
VTAALSLKHVIRSMLFAVSPIDPAMICAHLSAAGDEGRSTPFFGSRMGVQALDAGSKLR